MAELLKVTGLCAGYGKNRVLDGVSFSVEEGSLCALLGANGSGKTTLLRAVCGLTDASGGCMLKAENLWEMPQKARARRIGYLAQRGGLALSLSALDVVLMGYNPVLELFRRPNAAQRARARELLEQMGAGRYADAEFQTLSEGQRQVVLFARTLVCDPPLLVLDEPDSALDYANRHAMLQWLKAHARARGAGILLCSHDANIALRYADQLLLLREGRGLCALSMGEATGGQLRQALSTIYGPVDVFLHNGHYLMTRGEPG